jgi:hypothetical protein
VRQLRNCFFEYQALISIDYLALFFIMMMRRTPAQTMREAPITVNAMVPGPPVWGRTGLVFSMVMDLL